MFNPALVLWKGPEPAPRAKDLHPRELNSYGLLRTHSMKCPVETGPRPLAPPGELFAAVCLWAWNWTRGRYLKPTH